jgi:hypothetical protein
MKLPLPLAGRHRLPPADAIPGPFVSVPWLVDPPVWSPIIHGPSMPPHDTDPDVERYPVWLRERCTLTPTLS